MPTDYDAIAEQYQASKQAEWRLHIEQYSFLRAIGDVSERSVLDLACGEGFYSRQLRRLGARRVLGVDSSPAMVDLARAAEEQGPVGVEYLVADVRGLDLAESFDLVVAGYLLNYASSATELLEMCRAVARHLAPGGRFVTINANPELGARTVDYRTYGFERLLPDDFGEGSPYVFRNHQGATSFDISIYQLGRETHEATFAAAGLGAVRWLRPEVSGQGEAASGPGYWRTFLGDPPIILIECRKNGRPTDP